MKLLLLLVLLLSSKSWSMHNDENWAKNSMVWYAQKQKEGALESIDSIPLTKQGKKKEELTRATIEYLNKFFAGNNAIETLAAFIMQNFQKQAWAVVLGRISIILDADENIWRQDQIQEIIEIFKKSTTFVEAALLKNIMSAQTGYDLGSFRNQKHMEEEAQAFEKKIIEGTDLRKDVVVYDFLNRHVFPKNFEEERAGAVNLFKLGLENNGYPINISPEGYEKFRNIAYEVNYYLVVHGSEPDISKMRLLVVNRLFDIDSNTPGLRKFFENLYENNPTDSARLNFNTILENIGAGSLKI